MIESVVTASGTLTVPAEVCSELSLRPGDTVTFTTLLSGDVLVTRRGREATSPASMKPRVRFGFVPGLTVPGDFDEPLPDDVLRDFEGR